MKLHDQPFTEARIERITDGIENALIMISNGVDGLLVAEELRRAADLIDGGNEPRIGVAPGMARYAGARKQFIHGGFTAEHIALIRERYVADGPAALSKRIGCSASQLRRVARVIGVVKEIHTWTADDQSRLESLLAMGVIIREIAEVMDMPLGTIKMRVRIAKGALQSTSFKRQPLTRPAA